mmetsp:Transcript_82686/g.145929  ORF Transcript_82686/g.145929 Transcript_82686/m.145929 type:complete len:248 (+) Transcript_82686:930-1673(+)
MDPLVPASHTWPRLWPQRRHPPSFPSPPQTWSPSGRVNRKGWCATCLKWHVRRSRRLSSLTRSIPSARLEALVKMTALDASRPSSLCKCRASARRMMASWCLVQPTHPGRLTLPCDVDLRSVCTCHCLRPRPVPQCSRSTLATHPTTSRMQTLARWASYLKASLALISLLLCERHSWSRCAFAAQQSSLGRMALASTTQWRSTHRAHTAPWPWLVKSPPKLPAHIVGRCACLCTTSTRTSLRCLTSP